MMMMDVEHEKEEEQEDLFDSDCKIRFNHVVLNAAFTYNPSFGRASNKPILIARTVVAQLPLVPQPVIDGGILTKYFKLGYSDSSSKIVSSVDLLHMAFIMTGYAIDSSHNKMQWLIDGWNSAVKTLLEESSSYVKKEQGFDEMAFFSNCCAATLDLINQVEYLLWKNNHSSFIEGDKGKDYFNSSLATQPILTSEWETTVPEEILERCTDHLRDCLEVKQSYYNVNVMGRPYAQKDNWDVFFDGECDLNINNMSSWAPIFTAIQTRIAREAKPQPPPIKDNNNAMDEDE